MKKIYKKIVIVSLILVFIFLLIAAGFFWKFKSEISGMTPAETGNITKDIFAVKNDFVNMYLIKDSSGYIAVDAGKDIDIIRNEMKKLYIEPDKVTAVLLTHTDMDHVAALPLFKNAKVYLSANEIKMLNGEKQKVPFINNSIGTKDYVLLEDKQTIFKQSVKIYCILTEGHTSGSMCYLINDKYVFTGDILSLKNGKINESVKFFDLDHEMTLKSISKITNLSGVEYLFTSHFGYSGDYNFAVRDWKK